MKFTVPVVRGLLNSGQLLTLRALTKSGRKCYVEMSFALVKDDAGVPIGAVAMARDVTARLEQERAAQT